MYHIGGRCIFWKIVTRQNWSPVLQSRGCLRPIIGWHLMHWMQLLPGQMHITINQQLQVSKIGVRAKASIYLNKWESENSFQSKWNSFPHNFSHPVVHLLCKSSSSNVMAEQLLTVGWGAQFKCTKGFAIIRPNYWTELEGILEGLLSGKEHWNIYPILDSPTGQEKDWTFSTMMNGFYIFLRNINIKNLIKSKYIHTHAWILGENK